MNDGEPRSRRQRSSGHAPAGPRDRTGGPSRVSPSDRRSTPDQPDGRPPRRPGVRAPKPDLPVGVDPQLPGNVRRELRQHVRGRDLGDEVGLCLQLAGDAIDDDAPGDALPYLEWAKQVAPRAPVIREALGVARYLAGDFTSALNELRAYRRLSGSPDQDHVIADCLRASNHPVTEVGEVAQAMLASEAPADRRLEAILVWAGAVADAGDLAAARAVLRRADRTLVDAAGEEARERLTYVAGDLAARAGETDAARRAFERLARLEDDPYDAADRLAHLGG